jgi:O-antigen biosynthesis protein
MLRGAFQLQPQPSDGGLHSARRSTAVTLRLLRAGLRRFFQLVRTRGPVWAAARGIQFVLLGKMRSIGAVLTEAALDPSRPGALSAQTMRTKSSVAQELEPLAAVNSDFGSGHSICFVLRVTMHDPEKLERTIQSILRQTLTNWEILLSPIEALAADLDSWLDLDWRIRRLPEPLMGRHDVVVAAQYATARYVGLIVQGDTIDDELIDFVDQAIGVGVDADIIYTDEARLAGDGTLVDHYYKPDWSPEHLNSVNYIGKFVAFRKERLLDEKSVRLTESLAASDYELLLTMSRSATEVVHIDDALYFDCRPQSSRIGGFFSAADVGAAKRVLENHVQRDDPLAKVVEGKLPGSFEVRWPIGSDTQVTLVVLTGMRRRDIPGRGQIVLVSHFVRSIIERSRYPTYRILVVDDGDMPDDLQELLRRHGHQRCSYLGRGEFSFAKKANFAIRQVDGGVVILLNDDMEVINHDWIEAMAGLALQRRVGAVGAKLHYPDGSIQHTGITLGFNGAAGHIFHGAPSDGMEYAGFASVARNYSAVTGAAMAFRKLVFDELGGFDEQFGVDYNDVDFCLRLRHAGYRVAVTPGANLYHFHNSSFMRKREDRNERNTFIARWGDQIDRDPYFNKHFQRRHSDLALLLVDLETHQ